MFLHLLTHKKELERKTGTGNIVIDNFSNSKIYEWKRLEPVNILETELDPLNTVVVYPGNCENVEIEDLTNIENYIILDGTWQEAKKIYNKSPYLKRYRQFKFNDEVNSEYILRKNQKKSGLCTIETVIKLLEYKSITTIKLRNAFDKFNTKKNQPQTNEVGI